MTGIPSLLQARAYMHRNAPDVAKLALSHFADVFLEIDRNGDGRLNREELRLHLKRRGTEAQAERLFAQLDTDDDGSVSVAELKLAYTRSAEMRCALGPIH